MRRFPLFPIQEFSLQQAVRPPLTKLNFASLGHLAAGHVKVVQGGQVAGEQVQALVGDRGARHHQLLQLGLERWRPARRDKAEDSPGR